MPENLKMRNGISVIIPTYNREALIVEAIESVLNQKYEGPLESSSLTMVLQIILSKGSGLSVIKLK